MVAQQSMVIEMERYHLIKTYLDSGELVAPCERVSSGFGYDLP